MRLRHAVQLDCRRLEIVRHARDTLRPDDVHVGVMRLLRGQLPVNMPLRDVEHHAVLERSVTLQPPRVLVVPHAHGLRVPCLELRFGVPARDIDVVHPAVVERRPFVFVPLARRQPRRHVAYADDRQFADLARGDELLDRIVIPRIAQIEVDRGEQRRLFDERHRLPFAFHAVGDRFLRDDMLACRDGLADLRQTGVGQREETDDRHLGIVEDDLFIGDYLRLRSQPAGLLPRFGRDVADVGHLPPSALLHLFEIKPAHSAEADHTDFNRIHFVLQ